MIYRQGDILITAIDSIPDLPRVEGRMILAEGEVTGHVHEAKGAELFRADDIQEMEESFLRVEQEAFVEHAEHATITLPPGNYRVARQRQYAPEGTLLVGD